MIPKINKSLQETNGIAAMMFFLFAVSVSWILVNVMLTIIIDGYEKVKKELAGQKNDLEVIQYIRVNLYSVWHQKYNSLCPLPGSE